MVVDDKDQEIIEVIETNSFTVEKFPLKLNQANGNYSSD